MLEGADPQSFQPFEQGRSKRIKRPFSNIITIAKDKNHVYVGGEVVKDADPDSFKKLGDLYAIDKERVFFDFQIIEGADRNTFRELNKAGSSFQELYHDRNHVYLNGKVLEGIDASTITSVGRSSAYSKDQNHVYYRFRIMEDADPETFTGVSEVYRLFKDKNHLYDNEGKIIPGIDGASFTILRNGYAKDKDHAFYWHKLSDIYDRYARETVQDADPATFAPIFLDNKKKEKNSDYARDELRIYYRGVVVKNADPQSFALQWDGFAKDRDHVYFAANEVCDDDKERLASIELTDKKLARAVDRFDSSLTQISGVTTFFRLLWNAGNKEARENVLKNSRLSKTYEELAAAVNGTDNNQKTVYTANASAILIEDAHAKSFQNISNGIARDKKRLFYCTTNDNLGMK